MGEAISGPIQILVVEDDQDMRDTMQLALEGEGYAVTTATSLQSALDLIETQTFHLIVTDLFAKSPANALGTVAPLIARAYPIAVGVLSGWRISQEEIERSGIRFRLPKPFDLDTLLAAVAASLASSPLPRNKFCLSS
jgi:two-component system response regulator PilR (NtrC family)